MSICLLFAISFKGGVADHGPDTRLIAALLAGAGLSFLIPFAAFALLKTMTRLSATDAAAVAAHFGSISIVTFVTGSSLVQAAGLVAEGYMVAVAVALEASAIISALHVASRPWRVRSIRPLDARGAGGPQRHGRRRLPDPARSADTLLEAAFTVVDRNIGVIGVTDAEVLRAERF